jgi:hypothetical protein
VALIFMPPNLFIVLKQYIETNDHWSLLTILLRTSVILLFFYFVFHLFLFFSSLLFSWLSIMIFFAGILHVKGCKFVVSVQILDSAYCVRI